MGCYLFGYHFRASIIESTIFDSSTSFVRNIFKKAFLSRLDISLVPGTYNSQLLRNLGFKRNIIHTYGVGIINKTPLPSSFPALHLSRDSFLFVGRLVEEKNFQSSLLSTLPNLNLFIIGDGPLSSYLQSIANSNIKFLGHQTNEFVHCALGKWLFGPAQQDMRPGAWSLKRLYIVVNCVS